MPSDALGETMKLFEELADALDAHKLKITDILVSLANQYR